MKPGKGSGFRVQRSGFRANGLADRRSEGHGKHQMTNSNAQREFQIFAKPVGAACNLNCHYCYYLEKACLFPDGAPLRMADDVLESYIAQHIAASPGKVINFHWHGGEPTLLGIDYFQKVVELQKQHCPPDNRIINVMQTNGTLINEAWCRFLSKEGFTIGLSLDGPEEMHDTYRVTRQGKPTHRQAMRGYHLLQQHDVSCDVLCVVNSHNVAHPTDVYRFFKQIGASYVGFLPLVERRKDSDRPNSVSSRTVPSEALGVFYSTIFDEWKQEDIGKIIVQNFEEVAKTALGQEHALCIFRKTCGDVPVIEHNGDFFSCDHFVEDKYRLGNILETPLVDLFEGPVQRAFGRAKEDGLPRYCRECPVLDLCNGGCPKDRFCRTPDGEAGLNYLCEGYRIFFSHCQPFVTTLKEQSRLRSPKQESGSVRSAVKTGRNDPCPCGSGRKYKKCCMGK